MSAEEADTTSMSEAAVRLEAVQILSEEMHELQKENRRNEETLERVVEIVEESHSVVEKSEIPHEMLVDATILNIGAQIAYSTVTGFNTNLTAFNEDEYEMNLLSCLEELKDNTRIINSPWETLFSRTYHLFRKTEPITYMLGTFNLEPLPKKERKKAERIKSGPEAQKKVLANSGNKDNETEEDSDVYKHIFKCLHRSYRKNGGKPIGYFDFVIDPTDYWKTIENVFHFSFLVRDDLVKMAFNANNLPVVEPSTKDIDKEKSVGKKSSKTNQQFCFRLSVQEWEDCISSFNITNAMITPFNKKK